MDIEKAIIVTLVYGYLPIVLRVDPPSSQFDLLPVGIEKTNLVHLRCIGFSWNGTEIDI